MTIDAGIVLRPGAEAEARRAQECGLEVRISDGWALPWPKTLFVAPAARIPWDLVPVGFALLDRWDVAAPFDAVHILAADVGTPADRGRTLAAILDLRVPLLSAELLLVSTTAGGRAFLGAWRAECAECDGGDERLAFLRALARVKPLFCVLPRLWLAPEAERAQLDAAAVPTRPPRPPRPKSGPAKPPSVNPRAPQPVRCRPVRRLGRR